MHLNYALCTQPSSLQYESKKSRIVPNGTLHIFFFLLTESKTSFPDEGKCIVQCKSNQFVHCSFNAIVILCSA